MMARRNPSDMLEMPSGSVGEARDFLQKPYAFLRPFRLLKVARELSQALHNEIDFSMQGVTPIEELLPEETARRAEIGRRMVDEFAARKKQVGS